MHYDVIVVGGGVVGASVFSTVSEHFPRTAILEQKKFAYGATGYSGGFIRGFDSNEYLAKLTLSSYGFFEEYSSQTGFQKTGILHAVTPEKYPKHVDQLFNSSNRKIVSIDNEKVSDYLPHLKVDPSLCYIYEEDGGYACPIKTTHHLLSLGKSKGGHSFEGVEVLKFNNETESSSKLHTNIGNFTAKFIVICAGGWSNKIGGSNYLNSLVRVKDIQVEHISGLKADERTPGFFDYSRDIFFRQLDSNSSLVGRTLQHWNLDPNELNPLDRTHAENTLSVFKGLLKQRQGLKIQGGKRSMDAYTDTGLGGVEWLPDIKNVLTCTGWSGSGFKISPALGRCVKNILINNKLKFEDAIYE